MACAGSLVRRRRVDHGRASGCVVALSWRRWCSKSTTLVDCRQPWGVVGGFVMGVGWSSLFPPGSPLIQLFLTMVIGGMCAGAVVISASHQPAQRAFLLAACLPMAGRFM